VGRIHAIDHFETPAGLLDLARRPGTYFALGHTGVRSDGGFMARRKSDLITIEGTVAHRLDSRPEADNQRGLIGDPPISTSRSPAPCRPVRWSGGAGHGHSR
jgi:hypothetical protein